MQQGRTAGQSFKPAKFIDFFESPHKVQAKIARVIVRAVEGLTVTEIQTLAGCSAATVRTTVQIMRRIKGVYVIAWRHGKVIMPIYAVGSLPDAVKPESARAQVRKKAPPSTASVAASVVVEVSPEVLHFKNIASALVPKRNDQEQQEINRLYLNWISEGTYG